MQVKGYVEGDVKHFTVSHEGEKYGLRKQGQKYECCGEVATLKQHKLNIAEGLYDDEFDEPEEAPEPVYSEVSSEWDCVNPSALICILISDYSLPQELKRGIIDETLNKLGWLTPDGNPDLAKVTRELQRLGHVAPAETSQYSAPTKGKEIANGDSV